MSGPSYKYKIEAIYTPRFRTAWDGKDPARVDMAYMFGFEEYESHIKWFREAQRKSGHPYLSYRVVPVNLCDKINSSY